MVITCDASLQWSQTDMRMQKLTRKIYRALAETGEAAIIGKGWGNLGVIEACPTLKPCSACPNDIKRQGQSG